MEGHGGPAPSRFVSVQVESASRRVAATPLSREFSLPNVSDIVANQNPNMSVKVLIRPGDLDVEQIELVQLDLFL